MSTTFESSWENERLQEELATLRTKLAEAQAKLPQLGDWVYEKMQNADAQYHDHGDDTAEVYATLSMVLSKIESMLEDVSTDTNKIDTK